MKKVDVQKRILKNGRPLPLDLFDWDETGTLSTLENHLTIDFGDVSNCTFITGSDCVFKTGDDCVFKTGDDCRFDTGGICTFNTGDRCTFNTGDRCIFDTGSSCVFKTGDDCTFDTLDNCTFDTGDRCKVKASGHCIYKAGLESVITCNARNSLGVFYPEKDVPVVSKVDDGQRKVLFVPASESDNNRRK